MNRVFWLCAIIFLQGCTFKSAQLDTIVQLGRLVLPAADIPTAQAQYQWLASYGAETQALLAVDQAPFIVFANDQGTAVAFDGWHIRSIVGFDLNSPLSIQYRDNDPVFRYGNQRVRHACSTWEKRQRPDGADWIQNCKADFYYENKVALDAEGRIIRVSQVIDATGTRLLLRKNEVD